MAKKMDNLSKDMVQCKKDGYGCHYGKWKAMQEIVTPPKDTIPEGWSVCPYCGKPFKPKKGKRFCELYCRERAYAEKAYTRKLTEKEGSEDG